MRFSFLALTVSTVALLAVSSAQAQNYVQAKDFSGPNVVIDFAALDTATAGANQWAVAPAPSVPVMQEGLPDVGAPMMAPPPLQLRPPMAKQQMAMAPVQSLNAAGSAPRAPMPASSLRSAPSTINPNAPMPSMKSALAAATASSGDELGEIPSSGNFAARDMIDGAPVPPPSAPMASEEPVESPQNMLAAARTKGPSDSRDRVNLASISSGRPMETRTPNAAERTTTPPMGYASSDAKSSGNGSYASRSMPASIDLPEPVKSSSSSNKTSSSVSGSKAATLEFSKDGTELSGAAKSKLDGVIKSMQSDSSVRAQIRAYASGTPETSGQARRVSLTRALAARSYILDQDIPATRLDIRALGNGQAGMDNPSGSMDKVEISLVN